MVKSVNMAYEGIFSTPLGVVIVADYQLKLIVFDSDREEIVQWLD